MVEELSWVIIAEIINMEVKKPIFKRVAPGDRWTAVDGDGRTVHPSLTDALEYSFQQTGNKQYFIDAGAGLIFKVVEEADPIIPPRQFSIYDDELDI